MHGISVPVGKVGYSLPRTISNAIYEKKDGDDIVAMQMRQQTRSGDELRLRGPGTQLEGEQRRPPQPITWALSSADHNVIVPKNEAQLPEETTAANELSKDDLNNRLA